MTIPLAQAGIWQGGSTPSKANSAFWDNGTIPWVSPKDMKKDRIDTSQDLITPEALDASSTRLIPSGSLLFVTRSGILRHSLPVAANTVPVAINQDIKALTLSPDLNADFLRYQIQARSEEILSATSKSGTTVESIDFGALKKINIFLPPVGEQQRIVRKLDSALERMVEIEKSASEVRLLLDQYRRSFLARTFDVAGANGDERSTSRGWLKCTLGEIAEIQTGVALGKKRLQNSKLVTRPYLRVANVQRGRLDLAEIRTINVTEQEADKLLLRSGDILMNEGGDRDKLGRGWIWEGQIELCIHQNHVFRVRLRDPAFPAKYISYFANEFGRDHFSAHGTQTTNLASISKAGLASLPITLPSAEKATEIVHTIDRAFEQLAALEERCAATIEAVDALRKRVLAKAFRGELVTPDLSESAPKVPSDQEHNEKTSKTGPKASRKPATIRRHTVKEQIIAQLESWPPEGRTFEEVSGLVTGDYESLKQAVFALLSGSKPVLRQRYDNQARIMRLVRISQ
ncbi:restriction endonuclease subunit S [Bradyrhizobium sp. PRIMUS42]|uniref:restriction endonuclease subunit S n=1 Tax=Bradyrhizobium sp. PRIMUS42 TaxID=2908926 RepID=UPI001FF43594|nr:restriction endonuclease subunit S [Bradyrhizobium sp. PRIMUS42]MCJ9732818.1 restriction endonuclease subunit S [Bradyrhizobium sp. PRIMUS42]